MRLAAERLGAPQTWPLWENAHPEEGVNEAASTARQKHKLETGHSAAILTLRGWNTNSQIQFHAALLRKTLTSTVCLSVSHMMPPSFLSQIIFVSLEKKALSSETHSPISGAVWFHCAPHGAHLENDQLPNPICALRAKLAQPSGKAGPECYSAYVLFLLHQFISITEITLTHYCVMKTQSRATNAQSTPDCPNITQSQNQDICNNSI